MDIRDQQDGITPEHFWFKGKMDLINVLLQRTLKGSKGAQGISILSIGAGTGEELAIASEYGEVHALDISQEALDHIPEGLVKEKTLGNAENLPYSDNSFDLVLALDVLEHLDNDKVAAHEITRVLKKDSGYLVCTVPAHPFLFSAHDRGLGHHRRYTMKQVRHLFRFETDSKEEVK